MPLKRRSMFVRHDGGDKPTGVATKDRGAMTPSKLLAMAPQILRELEEDSPFFDSNQPRQLPQFDIEELALGPLLGEGAFSRVNEIVAIELKSSSASSIASLLKGESCVPAGNTDKDKDNDCNPATMTCTEESTTKALNSSRVSVSMTSQSDGEVHASCRDEQTRHFMQRNCKRLAPQNSVHGQHSEATDGVGENYQARYAIKRLLPDLNESERAKGIVDMAIETKFLTVLSHPNIVKMRATASGDSLRPDFFILLDRLFGTLDDRIDMWREDRAKFGGFCCGLCGGDKGEKAQLWLDRLLVAYDLSSAMRYLHKNSIVYRDIKPENIGFDIRSDVKIFDFGLAKELRAKDKTDGDLYKVTGRTGSLLYMAPEVATCKPYNLSVDAYSFGILLWEMCSLEQPFLHFTSKEVYRRVAIGGYRPTVEPFWPSTLKSLMKDCWDVDHAKRPTFERICDRLHDGFASLASDRDELSISNRSAHLMDRSMNSRHGKYTETEWGF